MSYRIDPGAPLDAETRRVFTEQLDKATAELSAPASGPDGDLHEAIHDARKRLKKLRGLLRLVRPGHERFYRTENERLRDIARTLSAVRDRTALIESLDALEAHVPASLAASAVEGSFAGVRAGLETRRRAALEAAG
ncbi:MAG: CHAD domain-containing protein, partial [Rhizobiaceae bacterium]|nr:CHAD domain-containing protein [Rhizobiaceae bacterium]